MLRHLKLGFFYTAIGKYSNFLVQLIVNMVLSRLLTPDEFGVVAIVQVFLLFFTMLVDAGLGPAIIENKSLTKEDDRVLFGYGIRLGILLAIGFIFFGPILCMVYGDWAYFGLTVAMSVTLLFQGFNTVPNALLDKEKRFKEVNIRLVLGNVCGGLAGIAAAFAGLGAYSLIITSAIPAIVAFVLNLHLLKLRPARHVSRTVLNKVIDFAKNQFGFNFINYFSRNADNILIGKLMGPGPLANYSKAYQLLIMPSTLLLGVINPVLQPVLSDYQHDVAYVRRTYLKIVHLLGLIGMPLSVFLSIEAGDVIVVLFGHQWAAAVPPFRILALTVWIQMTLSSTGAIFQAMNKSQWLFRSGCISAAILVTSIIFGVYFGSITTVAIFLSIGFLVNYFVSYTMVMHQALDSTLSHMMKQMISPAVLALALAGIELGVQPFLVTLNIVVRLAIHAVVFLLVLLVGTFLTKDFDFMVSVLRSPKAQRQTGE